MNMIDNIPNVEQELDNAINQLHNKILSVPVNAPKPANAPKPVDESGVSTGGVPLDSAVVEITNYRGINIKLPSGVDVNLHKHDECSYKIDIKYKGKSVHRDTGNMKIKQKLEQIKNIFLNK